MANFKEQTQAIMNQIFSTEKAINGKIDSLEDVIKDLIKIFQANKTMIDSLESRILELEKK